MPFFLSIYAMSLMGFFIHMAWLPSSERSWKKAIELLLLYQLVFSVGLTSLVAFFGLTFLDEYIAKLTDWQSCPFEQQLANVNLGYALLGILCIWLRGYFWYATIIGFSVWILGDGIHHLYHYFVHGNVSSGNVGVPLITDFAVPILLLILLFGYSKSSF